MIDEETIKENYSRMADAELLNLAYTEGHTLTPAATLLLYSEFTRRALDTSLFLIEDDGKISIQPAEAKNVNEDASAFMKSIWTYIFIEMEKGHSNKEIFNGLLQRGLSQKQSVEIIFSVEEKAKEILAEQNKHVLRGAIIALVGLAISTWTYSSTTINNIFILSSGAIAIGILLLFKGVASKSRFKTIVAHIETTRIISADQLTEIEIVATNSTTNAAASTDPDNPAN